MKVKVVTFFYFSFNPFLFSDYLFVKKSNGFKMYIDISGIFIELLVYVVVNLSF